MGGAAQPARLAEYVSIRSRFHRSANLEKDVAAEGGRDHYIALPHTRRLAERIVLDLDDPLGSRAWSLTGPFGSGKSSFALFLADILARESDGAPGASEIRRVLRRGRKPMLPVVVTGSRTSLERALIEALERALSAAGSKPLALTQLEAIDPGAIASLFQAGIERARQSGYDGIVLIVDEFGKFLEYAVLHPDRDGHFAMQYLAELAARSPGDLLVMTIQHTAYADYFRNASGLQAREWQKIQGRFVDEAFYVPPAQLLELVAAAIVQDFPASTAAGYSRAIVELCNHAPLQTAIDLHGGVDVMQRCAPLHPLAAVLMPHVFRSKLAQNERSLFAFLSSWEPGGFHEFLAASPADEGVLPLFPVHKLYDYLVGSLGSRHLVGDFGRKWSIAESALERIGGGAPEAAVATVKTIALLDMFGAACGVSASADVLELAIGSRELATEAIAYLERRSIIVFRRHRDGYVFWDGSDLDLEACYQHALVRMPASGAADLVQAAMRIQPRVARKHALETGTFRACEVVVIDADIPRDQPTAGDREKALRRLEARLSAAAASNRLDGTIVYVLCDEGDDRDAVVGLAERWLAAADRRRPCILGVPRTVQGVVEAAREVAVWTWVLANEPALGGDVVARSEVVARLSESEVALAAAAGAVFGAPGHRFEPSSCDWYTSTGPFVAATERAFANFVSAQMDRAYRDAPAIKNELLNRSDLSSAAAKARRDLLERMLVAEDQERLGIPGYPPHLSMYLAVLHASGIHACREGAWTFGAPSASDWTRVWQTINDRIDASASRPTPVQALFDELAQPPFGLRQGVLPVVVMAAILARRREIALYEDGVFSPELRVESVERLVRSPQSFAVRRLEETASLQDVLTNLASVVGAGHDGGSTSFLDVVRGLVTPVSKLEPYAKRTRRFENPPAEIVVGVRSAILGATDPIDLVRTTLPAVVGVDPAGPGGAERFARVVGAAIDAMRQATLRLLDEIEGMAIQAFGLAATGAEAGAELRERAAAVQHLASTIEMTTFVGQAVRTTDDWRAGIGRAVMQGTPPSNWNDATVRLFENQIRLLAVDFLRLEELATARTTVGSGGLLRVDFVGDSGASVTLPMHHSGADSAVVDDAAGRLRAALAELVADDEMRIAVLAAALVMQVQSARKSDGDE